MLTFEDATIDDLPLIILIYNSTIPSRMVTADTEAVKVQDKLNWFHAHNKENRPLWIVKNRDVLIGWVSFQSFYGRPAYQSTAEISIYLDERHRGRGYGKIILEHCMKACPKLKIRNLLGFIFGHNGPSISLFESMGFKEWATLPEIAELDGKRVTLKIFGKSMGVC